MVEDEDAVGGEEVEVGESEFVLGRWGHGGFEVADGVVGQIADAAAGEVKGAGGGVEAGHFAFEFGEGISGGAGADDFAVAADFKAVTGGEEFAFRAGAEDRVASAFFVLLGGFEKEGGFVAGDFGEGGDGGFGVGHEFGPDRDDAVRRGEGGEFVEGWLDRGRRHEERLL